jgi:hypothetical protein
MSPLPERILLLRSGRHLRVALDVLQKKYPGCQVRVVATPGTEHAVEQAGVARGDYFIYGRRPQFEPWALFRSGIALQAWWRGYDRVAVLWLDPDGLDRSNVNRTALLLAPRGFDAITPDGRLIRRRMRTVARRELSIVGWSMATLAVLAMALWAPAALVRAWPLGKGGSQGR